MTPNMIVDLILLALILITAVATVETRNLFAATMLASIYSLLMACFWVSMDAVDVAYTEAAVGAGISTILLIGTLVLTGSRETVRKAVNWPALLACMALGGFLIFGTLDMPAFGDPNAPAQQHPIYKQLTTQSVVKSPVGKSHADVEAYDKAQAEAHAHDDHGHGHGEHENFYHDHVPNQVTAVIVDYRAFDTMMETAVVFCAALGMIVLLRGRKGNPLRGGLL